MNDTTREVELGVRQLVMDRSGEDRLRMTSNMFAAARTLVMASLPAHLTDLQIKILLCERFYAGEVDVTAFARTLEAFQASRACL